MCEEVNGALWRWHFRLYRQIGQRGIFLRSGWLGWGVFPQGPEWMYSPSSSGRPIETQLQDQYSPAVVGRECVSVHRSALSHSANPPSIYPLCCYVIYYHSLLYASWTSVPLLLTTLCCDSLPSSLAVCMFLQWSCGNVTLRHCTHLYKRYDNQVHSTCDSVYDYFNGILNDYKFAFTYLVDNVTQSIAEFRKQRQPVLADALRPQQWSYSANHRTRVYCGTTKHVSYLSSHQSMV